MVVIEDYIGGHHQAKMTAPIDWFSLYSKKQFDFRKNKDL
jgi:hypothetical protein